MSNFGDSVAFAAMMTLYDELKQNNVEPSVIPASSTIERELPFNSQTVDIDNSNGYVRLCKAADSMFRSADAACNTVTDITADTMLPAIFCGIFYKAIKDSPTTKSKKIEIYDYVVNYCRVDLDFTGQELFSDDENSLAETIVQLTDIGLSTILMAANKSGRDEDGIGFITALAELVNFAEESLYIKKGNFKLRKKPALIVIDKAISFYQEQMQIMEAEDPSLKGKQNRVSESDNTSMLLSDARALRMKGQMNLASQKYRDVLVKKPQNWEAVFFSEFCEVAVTTPDRVRPAYISDCAEKIIRAAEKAIPLSKSQLYTRIDILKGAGGIAESVIKQAELFFVATMALYKSLPKNLNLERDKERYIGAIIRMLFSVGDIFEKYYCDDREICVATAYACWSIAISCYENCNMPQPFGTYEHWMKMKRYDPNCHCGKPIVSNATEGSTPQSKSGGCYIATAVYGTYDCPQVWTLRRLRDYKLNQTWYGRAFIRTYYALSPILVRLFGNSNWFKKFWKSKLDKMVSRLQSEGVKSTPYEDKTW